MHERREVKDAVANFVQGSGLRELTMSKIIEGVKPLLGDQNLYPNQLSRILKDDLHLHYRRYDFAMVRYNDPTFDHKRLWVSRLLAQFLSDNALIISVDESHLRHDT